LYFYIYSFVRDFYERMFGPIGAFPNLVVGYCCDWAHKPITYPLDSKWLCHPSTTTKFTRLLRSLTTAIVNMCKIKKISWSEAYGRLMEDGRRTGAGFMVMYRGLGAHTLGALKPAFQYALYEQFKKRTLAGQTSQALSALQAFNLGAGARAIADCICYPARTAKTRKQSALKTKNATAEQKAAAEKMQAMSSIEVLQHVVATEGIFAVYKGIEMEVGRGVLSAGLMLMVKERLDAVVRGILYRLFGSR
jgi:hypothetical protein